MLAISVATLLNAAATLYARATAPRQPPAIAVAPMQWPSDEDFARDLDDLIAIYPDFLRGHDGAHLFWRDGHRTPIGGQRSATPETIVAQPTIRDLYAWPYPLGSVDTTEPMGDPGRARPAELFTRLYGDCAKGDVESKLTAVRWAAGRTVRFTRVNGAADALAAVAREIDALGPDYARYVWPISGTYNCRNIAGSDSKSMHAYGAAIDLAARYGAYWRWGSRPAHERAIPWPIIAAFERHGFIWGGKWAHFDSFHFEFRPEIIRAARRRASGR